MADILRINGRAVLAPMAGAADSAFRLIARESGAAMVFSELVSADGLVRDSAKTFRLMEFLPAERPIGIQLFGCDPETMSQAAQIAELLRPDWIDLNFGCPAKKVVRRGAGSAVLKNLFQMGAIVKAVVSSVQTPVSVKIRSGWDEKSVNAVEAARIAEQAGARLVTLHPRTQSQGFRGKSDWDLIRQIKLAVSIPVIGNGDIMTAGDAKRMISETGCDMVMIGRSALGRPWIFSQINRLLDRGILEEDPPPSVRIRICLKHFRKALELLGEKHAVYEMRKHIGWYVKGLTGNVPFRREVFSLTDPVLIEKKCEEFLEQFESPIPSPSPVML